MKTYSGSCHCGAVRYKATMDLQEVMACNCSMCAKKGTLLSFVGADQFKLEAGESSLSDYLFHTKKIHHLFCSHCGVTSFARGVSPKDGKAIYAINVRCLDGVDAMQLPVKHVDGKSF